MNSGKNQEQTSYPIAAPSRSDGASSPSAQEEKLQKKREMWERIRNAFGPIIGGMIIDFFDLATFGPIGIYIGIFVGGAVGYWVGTMYKVPGIYRMLLSLIAGVYCAIPGTALIPFATIAGAVMRFLDFKSEK